jgi:DNA-binding transcriptional ArsR family regulator
LASKTKTKATTKGRSKGVFDQRLARALGHPLRVQALTILNERVASPNELAKELEEGLSQVSYHVKVLKDCECIELVKTEPRRGAVEHYYRATSRAFLSDSEWQQLPASIKPGMSASLLQTIMDDAVGALKAERFDARDERHLSWTPLIVDEQGWQDLSSALADTLERIFDIQTESASRLSDSEDEGLPATVAMMGFEAPASGRKIKKPRKP